MNVKQCGQYRLLRDFWARGASSCVALPKGTTIEVTQVDNINRKIVGPKLPDWIHWDLPVEEVE